MTECVDVTEDVSDSETDILSALNEKLKLD